MVAALILAAVARPRRCRAVVVPVSRAEPGRRSPTPGAIAVVVAVSRTDRHPVATPAPTAKPTPKPTPVAFSRAEKYLIEGSCAAESDCSPVRGDRPAGLAIAGIDCDLVASPAARMGFYLFKKRRRHASSAYMARVSVENLVVDSGACPNEGEGRLHPVRWRTRWRRTATPAT
jgi:hypothetical protein